MLTFDAATPLKNFWKKAEDGRRGAVGTITTHVPYFHPGRSSPEPIAQVRDAVLYWSTNDMQNIAPPATKHPHIPLPLIQEIEFET